MSNAPSQNSGKHWMAEAHDRRHAEKCALEHRIRGIGYRSPLCDKHIDLISQKVCPACELEQRLIEINEQLEATAAACQWDKYSFELPLDVQERRKRWKRLLSEAAEIETELGL